MKEKRILCIEVSEECKNFANINTPLLADAFECQQGLYCTKNTAWKPITKDACKNCKEGRYQGYTREQAREKIAKAIYKAMCPNFSQMFVGWRAYEKIAEAALAALFVPCESIPISK